MRLESQIEKLSEIGLTLNPGIDLDHFFLSFDRSEYERKPFDLILFVYGTEVEEQPWGRFFCDKAWNLDYECICEDGDYVNIVRNLHRLTGGSRKIENLSDRVDLENNFASLTYTVDGVEKNHRIKVNDDWADPETVSSIMRDLKSEDANFYAMENGQASVWFYLDQKSAHDLNTLAGNIFNLNKKPWWKIW